MHSGLLEGGKEDVYRKCSSAWIVRCVCGRYNVLGLEVGGSVAVLGGWEMVAAAGEAPCVALGVVPSPPGDKVSDEGLSVEPPKEFAFVMVTELILLLLLARFPEPDEPLNVAVSVPSCAAAPSRKIWMKYGPHLRATMRELTGIRSPPTARISISANSFDARARAPSSVALGLSVRPPACHGDNLPFGSAGNGIVGAGDEAETNPDMGVVFRGLS